jgi:hypothetical protein
MLASPRYISLRGHDIGVKENPAVNLARRLADQDAKAKLCGIRTGWTAFDEPASP